MKETDFENRFSNYGKTEPVGNFGGVNSTDTDCAGWNPGQQPGPAIPTIPPENGSGHTVPSGDLFQDYDPTMPVIDVPGKDYGFMPVVGWLVCVEGANRGRDYRLHTGYNKIGRMPSNDVCISGDATIAREKHALIAFDPEEKLFLFASGDESINLVRLNGKVLMMKSESLKSGDILTIGSTKLMFIPLCSETFSW